MYRFRIQFISSLVDATKQILTTTRGQAMNRLMSNWWDYTYSCAIYALMHTDRKPQICFILHNMRHSLNKVVVCFVQSTVYFASLV